MTERKIHLGYEVGTGRPVEIPCRHMVVTGQTQEAGKTTTLEGLISRSGLPAVAFVTKRGEQSFAAGRRIQPYFRERADWQFVASVLEATMRERLKFERAWIMRASKGARTLSDVRQNVRKLMKEARGLSADVYLTLDAYLEIVVPRVESVQFADRLDLLPGLNVLDLSDRDNFPPELQSLVMRSALEWVYEKCDGTIVIIPEAWEFLPQRRGSPVKLSAAELIRKGAGLRNYLWLDSQDIGGVDKEFLRSCPVWLLGVQREVNEVKRTLDNIPAGMARPSRSDIATLNKGQFFACWGEHVVKTYAQPAWMAPMEAHEISRGGKQTSFAPPAKLYQKLHEAAERNRTRPSCASGPANPDNQEDQVTKEEADELRAENVRLRKEAAEFHNQLVDLKRSIKMDGTPANVATPNHEELYESILARLLKEPAIIELRKSKPEIRVSETREVIDVDGKTLRGRLARLIVAGYFNEAHTASAAWAELQRLGFSTAKPNVYKECDLLAEMGFLTKEVSGYQAVPEMKVNIVKR